MNYKEWDLSPFRGEPVEQLTPNIWHMDPGNGLPSYVARVERGWDRVDIQKWKNDLAIAKVARDEFRLLNELGVNIVPFEIIMSRDRGIVEACAYVEGGPIKDAPVQDVDQTVTGLLRYYQSKFASPEPFMFDVDFAKQYMYGSIQKEEKKVYMVDVDVFRMYRPWRYPEPWIEIGKREEQYLRVLGNINKEFITGCGSQNRRVQFANTASYMAEQAVYAESTMEFKSLAGSVL